MTRNAHAKPGAVAQRIGLASQQSGHTSAHSREADVAVEFEQDQQTLSEKSAKLRAPFGRPTTAPWRPSDCRAGTHWLQ